MNTASHGRLDGVIADLQRIFGGRLEAVVAFGRAGAEGTHSLALVSSLTMDDLNALALFAPQWHASGAATPLVLPRDEFGRSLDAFPIEYGEIIDTHVVLVGEDPFVGIHINPEDVRRAVEVQGASLLLHLRENFVESAGRASALRGVVRDSAAGFALLLRRMAHLDGHPSDTSADLSNWASARAGLDPRVIGDVLAIGSDASAPVDPTRLFPGYLDTMSALLRVIDRWSAS
jgi:hypothetical protein